MLLVFAAPSEAQSVAGGAYFTIVAKPDGTVWTFGHNDNGQLGDNTLTNRKVPTQVSGLTDIVAVAAGAYHALALGSDGTLYAWGDNYYGQLGDGTTTDRKVPVVISISGVTAIAAGEYHSLVRVSGGDLYAWGNNGNGQLGIASTTNASSPTFALGSVTAIGAGMTHSLAVKSDGTAWASGLNGNGQLGDASTTQRTSFVQMSGITTASNISGGRSHSVVLLSDGTLKATGSDGWGQIGDGGSATHRSTAVAVSTVTNITAISANYDHTLARESDGTLWAWGANTYGQHGLGHTTYAASPAEITSLSGISLVATGHAHSVAASSTGVVWTWGYNGQGQLGDGTTTERTSPGAISATGYDWKVGRPTLSVASGTYNTDRSVVVTVETSGATIHYTRTGVEPTEADATVTSGSSVSVTYSQTLKTKAFKSGMPSSDVTSAVYTMTVGTPTFSPYPTTYTTAQTVTLATVTTGATIRFTTDGTEPTESAPAYTAPFAVGTSTTVKAKGFKTDWTSSTTNVGTYTMNFGTLTAPTITPATGTYESAATVTMSATSGAAVRYTTNDSAPTATSTLYVAALSVEATTTIRAKAFHPDYASSTETTRTYTITVAAPTFTPTGGTYPAGEAITVSSATPGATIRYTLNGVDPTTTDPTIASGTSVIAGNVTLKARAWKTGATTSTVSSATYTITGTLATPVIAAGYKHSIAARSDGIAWGWGTNGYGETADGTTVTPRLSPRMMAGVSGVVGLEAGTNFSVLLRSNGSVVAVGTNANGQIGDGTTTTRSVATAVSGLSSGVAAVAAGESHAVALKTDGTVVSWGANAWGQIGDGSTTQQLTPTAASNVSSVTAVAAGWAFTLARTQSGGVQAWGYNGEGRLGDGTTTNRSTAVAVSGVISATVIAAGWHHGLAVLTDGTVRAWGNNASGQLGDGTTTHRSTPVAVSSLSNVIAVAAGQSHTLALAGNGTVWAMGSNQFGQLGDGTTTDRSTAVQVSGLSGIVGIAAGQIHSLALDGDGVVWAWGHNSQGQLGDGTTTSRLAPVAISGAGMNWRVVAPTVSLASGLFFATQATVVSVADTEATLRYTTDGTDPTASSTTIASGGTVNIGQTTTLKVSAWKTGALTSVIVVRAYELKVVTPALSPGTGAYASSTSVSMSTTTSGAALRYTLDASEPMETSSLYSTAVNVAETLTVKARAYKAGWTASDSGYASYFISSGTVATPTISPAGGSQATPPYVLMATATSGATIRYTTDGTDPVGTSSAYRYPFLVVATTTVKARAFKPGLTSSAVTTVTYTVDAAGAVATPSISPPGGIFTTARTVTVTGTGTLRYTTTGVDPTETSATVTSGSTIAVSSSQVLKVRAFQSGLTPSAIRRADFMITGAVAAGREHSAALAADGTIYTWGWNGHFQLGDGTNTDRLSPVSVLTGGAAIAAGSSHMVVAKANGSVWTWGNGAYGQLGHGSASSETTPREITGFANAVAVTAGATHSLAAKADGTVWAWGSNDAGQLGDGSTTTRTAPVQVLGLQGIVAVAAGDGISVALQTDGATGGAVWVWGRNALGQMGDGSLLTRVTPVKVAGLTGVTQIAAGDDTVYALTAGGRIFAWGGNDIGQIGIGSTANQLAPREVFPLSTAWSLGAGVDHALAGDRSGRVWGWGQNGSGELGTGAAVTSTLVPARSNLSSALAFDGGRYHTLAIAASGQVLAVGMSSVGRLGNGVSGGNVLDPIVIPSFSLVANSWLTGDQDNDQLATWREYLLGTDPLNPDSNGNGLLDGVDEQDAGAAAHPDPDGDGVPNWKERSDGTDPHRADSDGDAVSDGSDAFPLDPSRSAPPSPTPGDTTPPVITLTEPVSARPVPPLE